MGSLVAIQAVAVVLVYRTHRIINFAQLQLGLLSSSLFLGLVQYREGIHLLERACASCLGGSVGAAPEWAVTANFLLSLLLCMALAPLLGFAVSALIIR